jgi:hypothetical protein
MTMPSGWKPKDEDIILDSEETIWRGDSIKGIINRKSEVQLITNRRVVQGNRAFNLSDLDDIVVMNQHTSTQFSGQRYYVRGFGASIGTGQAKGKKIGDVAFIYQGKPVIVFHQINDPSNVARLAKTARKRVITALKNASRVKVKNIRFKENNLNENIVRDENDFQENSEIMSCPNCGGALRLYSPVGYEGHDRTEGYCPNSSCEYASLFDGRFEAALKNYIYNENYDPRKWGFYFKGERKLWKPENFNEPKLEFNQVGQPNIPSTDIKRKEIIAKTDSMKSSLTSSPSDSNSYLDNNLRCSQCGFNNKSNSNFCGMCKNSLSLNCSKCGHINPSGSSFCNKCGYTLA